MENSVVSIVTSG